MEEPTAMPIDSPGLSSSAEPSRGAVAIKGRGCEEDCERMRKDVIVLHGKANGCGVLACVANDGQQDDADEVLT